MVCEEQETIRDSIVATEPSIHQRCWPGAEKGKQATDRGSQTVWRLALQNLSRHTILEGQEPLQDEPCNGILAQEGKRTLVARIVPSHSAGTELPRSRRMASGNL